MEHTITDFFNAIIQGSKDAAFIRQYLIEKGGNLEKVETERWLDIDELCEYLPDKPAKQTVYSWVSKEIIPFHKGSKKLRFSTTEIDQWLKSGKFKTPMEIRMQTDSYLSGKRKEISYGRK
jgi:excisionase family DNA binding protein